MDKITQPYNGLKNLSLRMMQACIQNGQMTETPPEVDEKAVVRDIRCSSLCIRLSSYDDGFILGSKSLTFSACIFLAVIDLYKKKEISTFISQASLTLNETWWPRTDDVMKGSEWMCSEYFPRNNKFLQQWKLTAIYNQKRLKNGAKHQLTSPQFT